MIGPLDLDEIRDLTELHARLAQIVDKGTRGVLARDDYVANAHRLAALVPALVAEVERVRSDLAANEGSEDARLAIAESDVAQLRQVNEQLRSALASERAKAWKVATLKCWTNEDGKRFVFVSDLQEALGVPVEQGAQS